MGAYLQQGLNAIKSRFDFISEVRGIGLLWAMFFESDLSPGIVAACNEAGLLLNPLRPNAVRLMPPLTVNCQEIDQALERLETGIKIGAT